MPLEGCHHADNGPIHTNLGVAIVNIKITVNHTLRSHQQGTRIFAQLTIGFTGDNYGSNGRQQHGKNCQPNTNGIAFGVQAVTQQTSSVGIVVRNLYQTVNSCRKALVVPRCLAQQQGKGFVGLTLLP